MAPPLLLPLALAAGGTIGGLLASRRRVDIPAPQQIDITQQLAMIDEAYNQQKQQAQTNLAESLKGQNKLTAQSLAGRGIYSSPVSQFSFGENQKSYAQALSQALSDLGAQQATQRAQLSAGAQQFNLGQQNQYNQSRYQQQLANRQMLSQALFGLGGAGIQGLMGSMGRGGNPTTNMVQSPSMQSYPYNPSDPFGGGLGQGRF